MRITFTNQTGKEITDINIIGCGGGHIDNKKEGADSSGDSYACTVKCDRLHIQFFFLDILSFSHRDVARYTQVSLVQTG